MVERMARELGNRYPNFDRDKFLQVGRNDTDSSNPLASACPARRGSNEEEEEKTWII